MNDLLAVAMEIGQMEAELQRLKDESENARIRMIYLRERARELREVLNSLREREKKGD